MDFRRGQRNLPTELYLEEYSKMLKKQAHAVFTFGRIYITLQKTEGNTYMNQSY